MRSLTSKSAKHRFNSAPRLYVQAIFALAAALALTTACSKQDGAQPNAGSAPAKAAAGAAKPSPTPSELDKASGQSAASHKRGEDLGTTNVGQVREQEPDPGAITEQADPASLTAKIQRMDPRVESVVYYDPSGQSPDQIFAKKAAIDHAGAFLGEKVASDIRSGSGETLFYTGAGQDTLREQLYVLVNNQEAMLDSQARAENKALAQSIQLSSFEVDWASRRGKLAFKYLRNGNKAQVEMEGAVDDVMQYTVGSINREPFIMADVACMDLSGGCKTVHIKVQDASSGQIRTAHMIARHTSASLYIEGNAPGVSNNPEYDRLMSILLNTTKNPAGHNVVNKLTLTTSETIGGASNFAITMNMNLLDKWGRMVPDLVQVTGPLAKPKSSDQPNVGITVSPAITVINGEVVPVEGRLVDVIRDARLLKNDGRGNLQVELTIRSATADALVDRIVLTVARIHTPTTQLRLPMN
ncbi:MAG: hypothetical protein U1E10_15435 [Bdellovibrionales bacterium]|nr:hypothetical protein [Bdellovibrionales bacterium]